MYLVSDQTWVKRYRKRERERERELRKLSLQFFVENVKLCGEGRRGERKREREREREMESSIIILNVCLLQKPKVFVITNNSTKEYNS